MASKQSCSKKSATDSDTTCSNEQESSGTNLYFWINLVPLSVNATLRLHWAKRRLYNRSVLDEMLVAKNRIKLFGRPEHSGVKIFIDISYCQQKPMDPDNLVAACKPIIDAAVKLGILKDDDPESVLGVFVTQKKVSRLVEAGTRVVFEIDAGR